MEFGTLCAKLAIQVRDGIRADTVFLLHSDLRAHRWLEV